MLQGTRSRLRGEAGFSLIEVLVVIIIIGVLAAIALPAFLGEQDKAADSSAKSNARNLVSYVAACFAEKDDYTDCDTAAELEALNEDVQLPIPMGTGVGEVQVVGAGARRFTVEAVSFGRSGGSNHLFTIVRDLNGEQTRTCSPNGEGGCNGDGNW